MEYAALTKHPITKSGLFSAAEAKARHSALVKAAKALREASHALGEVVESSTIDYTYIQGYLADREMSRQCADYILGRD